MDALPELLTPRLRLRAFNANDAPAVQRLAGAFEIAEMTLLIPHPYPDGAAEEWIAGHAAGIQADKDFPFAVTLRETDELIGCVGLHTEATHNRAEMGYWFGVPYWGQGYASEAARRVLEWGFEARELNRIYAGYFVHNPASRRVQEKIGMRFEGILRQDCRKNGVYVDVGICALTRDDFEAQRALTYPSA